MKRLHVHVAVAELQTALSYYKTLFGCDPCVAHDDYAKWMLDDPAVNFAISARGAAPGVDHLGIQVDSEDALDDFTTRLSAAGALAQKEAGAACCYARSEKTWSRDPAGVVWETFFTHGSSETFGRDAPDLQPEAACCGDGGDGSV